MSRPSPAPESRSRPALWLAAVAGALAIAGLAFVYLQSKPADPNAPPGPTPEGMVWIPGGSFTMGYDASPDRDAPTHTVEVDGFWMDATEVTNAQFRQFVEATGYVTTAERKPRAEDFPGANPADLVPFSAVFRCFECDAKECDRLRTEKLNRNEPAPGPEWWAKSVGASWRKPEGEVSSIDGKDQYPAVHISWEDAAAYAKWAGKRLPTEAEWERAARGGLERAQYAWGHDAQGKDGRYFANTYQGRFPATVEGRDGFKGLAPVKSFPANGFGLYDMSGNAWEWCADWYDRNYYGYAPKRNPTGPANGEERVRRGGSYLCADEYCRRYLPGTRDKGAPEDSACHTGFRCVKSPEGTGIAAGGTGP